VRTLLVIFGLLFVLHLGSSQIICLDPGHPSETSIGTHGKRVSEMHVVWEVAQRMRTLLKLKGIRVVTTKTSERQFVTNRRRAELANRAHADLMLRLHCDAGAGTGFAVYYPTQEGNSRGFKGPSRRVLEMTAPAAERFHEVLSTDLKGTLKDNGLMSDARTAIGSKQGALTGSVFSRVPVLLVEIVVLTNPKDEAFIISKHGMDVAARALVDAALQAIAVVKRSDISRKKK
jgi:N-acetylmuramoyl-L-alanine amidase